MKPSHCPRCHGSEIDRISRGPIVKTLLAFLPLKRYKCTKCGATFFIKDKESNLKNQEE